MAKNYTVEVSGKEVANQLTAQFKVAENARTQMLRESVKFGAMLIQWENYLGGNGAGRGHEGDGLKGWLAENCPEINYNTAKVYKALAVRAAKMLGGGAMAIAALQDESKVIDPDGNTVTVDADVIEKRDELFEEATSRRKFEQQYFEFAAESSRGKAGRPVGTGHALEKKSTMECAVGAVFPMVKQMLKHRGAMFAAYKVLPEEKLRDVLVALEEHVSAIKDQLKKRG